ncbi:MAG: type II glyceraldehyde-3-phosphate dehydrogenase [Desulfurococcales archaeon]|nr:type II glyceraldehyde-3-phosphate dehydrogenase [Desulfurococcales archaeon]
MKAKIVINGYGTIGKRVADAVSVQDDMEIVGVVKKSPDYGALLAEKKGYPLYAPDEEALKVFEEAGIKVKGTLNDVLSHANVVIDSTPGGVGKKNKLIYDKYSGLKQIYQGGEKPDVAEKSFSTLCNYEEALGADSLRVVSCNTTGLLRLLCTLRKIAPIEQVRAVMIRRAADPREIKKGPINSIVLNPVKLPSHHARDVNSVVPDINIVTAAVVVPTTLMHVHQVTVRFREKTTLEKIIEVLSSAPRIMLVDTGRTGIKSTAQLIEAARDMRPRNDIPELVVFRDSIALLNGNELMLFQAVHQESIVVPENVDAVRAVMKLAKTAEETVEKTDKSLGLRREFFY